MDSPWEDTGGGSGVLSCPPACLCGLAYKHKVAPEICQVGDDTGLASQEDTQTKQPLGGPTTWSLVESSAKAFL